MEEDTWSFNFSASSRNYRSAPTPKYQSEFCIELEDIEGDDEMAVDYPCPFCSEDYDLVELCYHIDEEHYLEANHGICPVCATRVRMNMVDHITTQHKNILKSEQKQRLCKDESYMHSPLSPRTNKYFQSLLDGSRPTDHASKSAPDPLLSFLFNLPPPNEPELVQPDSSREPSVEDKISKKETSEKDGSLSSPMSDSEQMEKARRCEFIQGLLSSTIFSDEDF